MKVTADTNLLIRAIVEDDAAQAKVAQSILSKATLIAIPIPVFCEFVWVLRKGYKRSVDDIVAAVTAITAIATVVTEPLAVEAGLSALRAGGDFADGVIAYQGARLGGEVFASFDHSAVTLLRNKGMSASLPIDLAGKRIR